MNPMIKFFFIALMPFLLLNSAWSSEIYIKLGEARTKKSLLAFPPLQYLGTPVGSTYNTVGSDLFNTITNDLTVASYFQFIPQTAFLEDTKKTGLKPKPEPLGFDFKSWSTIGADFLIRGAFTLSGSDINMDIYVYHVSKSHLIFGKKYKGTVSSVRKLAHTFSNDLLKELTGQEGMFTSKIVVSSDRESAPSKEIFLMDWDGAGPIQLTQFKTLSISPNWSPEGTKVAYTSYVQRRGKRNADLFLHDLTNGKRTLVSGRLGINSGASFTPDGKFIYLTVSQGNSPDIFKMTFDGNLVSKITNGPAGAMNVEPAVSWDGSKIAFSSDRAGRPMIYVMNTDGSGVKRLTFVGQFNASPSWSPDGSKIAFAGQTGNNFDVFVMNADGSNIVRLTSATKPNGKPANNEDPSFSPDGRFVMFTSDRTGNNQIYISTVDGAEERRVTQDRYNYFKPKWSRNF